MLYDLTNLTSRALAHHLTPAAGCQVGPRLLQIGLILAPPGTNRPDAAKTTVPSTSNRFICSNGATFIQPHKTIVQHDNQVNVRPFIKKHRLYLAAKLQRSLNK
jgi:hypothetical protein